MKRLLLLFVCFPLLAHADLTIVQNVDMGGTPGQMTIRIKGDKVRVDPAPDVSVITDNRTGDTVTLMHSGKKALRMSGEKMKAAAEMVNKFVGASPSASPGSERPKLIPTGRHEQINGMTTDVYTLETPMGKATYYIAPNYPDAPAIIKEMQSTQPAALAHMTTNMPDVRDLPGVPLKIEMDARGRPMVMTLQAIKRDPIRDSDFAIPPDYRDVKMPGILGGKNAPASDSAIPNASGQPQITPVPRPTP